MTQTASISDDSHSGSLPALTGQEPFVFVMNTSSGSQDAEEIQHSIVRAMDEAGKNYVIMAVDEGSQLLDTAAKAVSRARKEGAIVVAVGGDGTLNAVAQQVLGKGVPFGILPQGTFNYFGRCFGISQETEKALHSLLNARIRPVNVGLLNDRMFLVNASLGLYPTLLEDREEFKQRFGRSRLVALWSAVVTLLRAHRQLRLQIEYEGKTRTLRTPTIVVDNNALQLKHMGLDQTDELARDHLVAITSKPLSTLGLYGVLVRGLLSRLGEDENLISFGFDTLTVRLGRGRKRTKVAMDGEIFHLNSPLVFKVAKDRLPLLVPLETEHEGTE
ncbi:MAG: diacylglycerol/lipid kinase family protein [Pseudomonas sp.]